LLLPTPQTGHVRSSGISSDGVPGAAEIRPTSYTDNIYRRNHPSALFAKRFRGRFCCRPGRFGHSVSENYFTANSSIITFIAIFVRRARCAVKNQINTMMKKILFLMAATAMMWGCDAVKAQTLEPEFEGEVVGVFPDGSSKKLEKHNVRMRTGAGVYIAGFAASKSKTKVLVEGGSASVRFDAAQPIALIVRAKDNKADPMSIVRVFRMKSTKKNRSAVISAVGSFSVNSNTMDYLRFSAEKYGESSYRLTFDERPAGEYGIIVSNPNNVDEKMVIVSTFAIDGGAAAKE
jgi:hypothetical protein